MLKIKVELKIQQFCSPCWNQNTHVLSLFLCSSVGKLLAMKYVCKSIFVHI